MTTPFFTKQRVLWWAGLLLCGLVGFYNTGIIALDDYSNGIALMIPAQHQPPFSEFANSGVHGPWSKVLLQMLAKGPLALGVREPVWQLRCVLLAIGLFNFVVVSACARRFFEDKEKSTLALALTGFYFMCPLFLSRPMIESLSLPFVTLSAYLIFRYWSTNKLGWMLGSLVALAAAATLRYQAGCVAIGIGLVVLMKRNPRHLIWLVAASVLLFIVAGLPDLIVRGSFHQSLLTYVKANVEHGAASYGRMPFYVFPLFFVGLSLPPALFLRFKGFSWRKAYHPLLPVVLYFAAFVLLHTLAPHKEERFMVPVLPLFLILLVPLLNHLMSRPEHRWRIYYFAGVNGLLLVFTCLSIPQSNIIFLASYVQRNGHIQGIVSIEPTLPLFPQAYVTRPIEIRRVDAQSWPKELSCERLFVVPESLLPKMPEVKNDLDSVGCFSPGFLEAILVRINPDKNARRGTLCGFQPKGCHPG